MITEVCLNSKAFAVINKYSGWFPEERSTMNAALLCEQPGQIGAVEVSEKSGSCCT